MKTKRPDAEILADLIEVESQLSPENLSCDGERSMSQQRRIGTQLCGRWDALVKELGRFPTMGELVPSLAGGRFANDVCNEPGMAG